MEKHSLQRKLAEEKVRIPLPPLSFPDGLRRSCEDEALGLATPLDLQILTHISAEYLPTIHK